MLFHVERKALLKVASLMLLIISSVEMILSQVCVVSGPRSRLRRRKRVSTHRIVASLP